MARIKADVRREEILRATCREVIARGFASTRVGDVAAALGVSTGLVFYHFTNKETLLGEAFRYAASEDLERLSATAAGDGSAAQRLDRILRLYSPAGSSEAWLLWIDAWGQALRSPELAEVSRQLDLRWKQTLATVIREGVAAGEFSCADPDGAAWRLTALLDGLGVQVAVHRGLPAASLVDWVRAAAAAELATDPAALAGDGRLTGCRTRREDAAAARGGPMAVKLQVVSTRPTRQPRRLLGEASDVEESRGLTAGRRGPRQATYPARSGTTTPPGSTPTAPAAALFSGSPSPRRPRTGSTWTWTSAAAGTPLEDSRRRVADAVERAVAAGATR